MKKATEVVNTRPESVPPSRPIPILRPEQAVAKTKGHQSQGRTPSSGRVSTISTPASIISLSSLSNLGLSPPQDKVIGGEEVMLVSEKITKWQSLLRALFSPEDAGTVIEQLEADSLRRNWKIQDVCACALQEWKKRKGSKATVRRLYTSLICIGRTDQAEQLRMQNEDVFQGNWYEENRSDFALGSFPSSQSSSVSSFFNADTSAMQMVDMFEEYEVFSGNYEGKCSKSVEDVRTALNNPKKVMVSLLGPPKCGKTTTLNIVKKQLEETIGFEMTRVVKVQGTGQEGSDWLSRKIVEEITKQQRCEVDQTNYAIRALLGLLENYDDIILLLDISLLPWSKNGMKIVEFLLKLRKIVELNRKLKIVVSAIASMTKTSLFLQNRKTSVEIIAIPLDENEAIDFIKEMDSSFSKRVARRLVSKIDCYPFFLRRIVQEDLENVFVVDNKEDLLRDIECKFENLEQMFSDVGDVKDTLKTLLDYIEPKKQALFAQVLVFANRFTIEQANRVVDSRINLEDSSFSALCEQGVLFLTRQRSDFRETTYKIFKIYGKILRNIVQTDENLMQMHFKAKGQHQKMYLDLLVLLSDCFMGCQPSATEELEVLEPFTPSDGVPEELSIIVDDVNERMSRVVRRFREEKEDLVQSLMICNENEIYYKPAISAATRLNVYHFLTYMLSSLESLKIYRKMKREALTYGDGESVATLNVCIASLKVDVHGYTKFMSEAKSLYEASFDSLGKNPNGDVGKSDILAHCLQRVGVCRLAHSLIHEGPVAEQELEQGSEDIRMAREMFHLNKDKASYMVYVADCDRLRAAFYEEQKQGEQAKTLLRSSIETLGRILGSRHPLTCNARLIKSKIQSRQGDFDGAKRILYEVMDAEEDILGQHWQTARTLYEVALCRYRQIRDCEDNVMPKTARSSCRQVAAQPQTADGTDSDSIVLSTNSSDDSDTIIADLESIHEMRGLLKRAARYAWYANGKCQDAYDCFLLLAETSGWLGKDNEKTRFKAKAMSCASIS